MRIELHDVAKGPARARALEPTSTAFETGTAVLVEAETEQRPTVLGLIASGRMRPDAGAVLVDGLSDARRIRVRTALVDAPDVCDPAPDVTVYGLVEEELMFAGRPANLISARRWLDENGFGALGRMPISAVAPRERISLLLELTALRTRVEAMVLVSPDRHGGDPRDWWRVVEDFAARGYAMLVVAGRASATVLRGTDVAADLGAVADEGDAVGSTLGHTRGSTLGHTRGQENIPDAACDELPRPKDVFDEPDDTAGQQRPPVALGTTGRHDPVIHDDFLIYDDPGDGAGGSVSDARADAAEHDDAADAADDADPDDADDDAGAADPDAAEEDQR